MPHKAFGFHGLLDDVAQDLSMTNRLFSQDKQRADVCTAPSEKQTQTIKKKKKKNRDEKKEFHSPDERKVENLCGRLCDYVSP